MSLERRFCELRAEGRVLEGTALRYGDVASFSWGRERIERGAFSPVGDVILNMQHQRVEPLARTGGGGLELIDTPEALRVRASLPETQAANDALTLIRAKVLRGLSVEFHAREERQEGGVRIIERAQLVGVGVVDTPSYSKSVVEARARRKGGTPPVPNPWLREMWQARKRGECECQGDDIVQVSFEPGAFKEAVESEREILAIAGDASRAVASKRRGTLGLSEADDGGLDVRISQAAVDTPGGRELIETSRAVDIYARPIIDNEKSEFTDEGKVRRYASAFMRAILLKPSANADGWKPLSFPKAAPARRRMRVWL